MQRFDSARRLETIERQRKPLLRPGESGFLFAPRAAFRLRTLPASQSGGVGAPCPLPRRAVLLPPEAKNERGGRSRARLVINDGATEQGHLRAVRQDDADRLIVIPPDRPLHQLARCQPELQRRAVAAVLDEFDLVGRDPLFAVTTRPRSDSGSGSMTGLLYSGRKRRSPIWSSSWRKRRRGLWQPSTSLYDDLRNACGQRAILWLWDAWIKISPPRTLVTGSVFALAVSARMRLHRHGIGRRTRRLCR